MEAAESLKVQGGEALIEIRTEMESVLEVDTSTMISEKANISTFSILFV